MIKINTLNEAEKLLSDRKCTIQFQAFRFYNMNFFEEFINDIKNGKKFYIKNADEKNAIFYTNFAGEIHADTCIIGKKSIYFFKYDVLIIYKHREKTDDIELGYDKDDTCHYTKWILDYNGELDVQTEEWCDNKDEIY